MFRALSGGRASVPPRVAGRVFAESRGAALNAPPAGAHELQRLDPDAVAEIGEVLAGTRSGRISADELTVFKSIGHAVEDPAAVRLAERGARKIGGGTSSPCGRQREGVTTSPTDATPSDYGRGARRRTHA